MVSDKIDKNAPACLQILRMTVFKNICIARVKCIVPVHLKKEDYSQIKIFILPLNFLQRFDSNL